MLEYPKLKKLTKNREYDGENKLRRNIQTKRSKREEEASLRTLGPWAYAERPRDSIGPIRTCTAQEKEIPTTCRLFSSMKVGTGISEGVGYVSEL
ncbi:hypothetical protein HZH68_015033 [Vespula germanica]|uniref:Uncharacterized protein n=1 Tax=Vespula germanica TaxID=30212 RepID=A0A834J7F5_VESGE|nr:hypothetical protein HZH68_015033 [Vespula germanica]